jgi:hypothetical protein
MIFYKCHLILPVATVAVALRSGRDAALWLLPDDLNERIASMNTMDLEPARHFETSIIAQQHSVTSRKSWNPLNLIL